MKLKTFYKISDWEIRTGLKAVSIRRLIIELYHVPYERESKLAKQHLSEHWRFFVIHPNHVRFLIPLYQQMQAEKISFEIIAYSEGVMETLRKADIEHTCWEHSIRLIDYYAAAFKQLAFLILLKPYVLIRPTMKFKHRAIAKFYKSALLLEAYTKRELLTRGAKKIILFKAEGFQARTILDTANGYSGVQTIAVQHGLIDSSVQFSNLWVDRYLVWSEFFKERLQQANAGCQVEIAGNPVYDKLFSEVDLKPRNKNEVEKLRLLLLPNSGNSHTGLDQIHLLIDVCMAAMKKNEALELVVKPHPGDVNSNVARYLAANFKEYPRCHLLSRTTNIDFAACDVVVLNNSASGMEAAIWEKPIIIVATAPNKIMVPQYLDAGIAKYAGDTASFENQLNSIREGYNGFRERCRAFCDEQLAYQGVSAKRIVHLIDEE